MLFWYISVYTSTNSYFYIHAAFLYTKGWCNFCYKFIELGNFTININIIKLKINS